MQSIPMNFANGLSAGLALAADFFAMSPSSTLSQPFGKSTKSLIMQSMLCWGCKDVGASIVAPLARQFQVDKPVLSLCPFFMQPEPR